MTKETDYTKHAFAPDAKAELSARDFSDLANGIQQILNLGRKEVFEEKIAFVDAKGKKTKKTKKNQAEGKEITDFENTFSKPTYTYSAEARIAFILTQILNDAFKTNVDQGNTELREVIEARLKSESSEQQMQVVNDSE